MGDSPFHDIVFIPPNIFSFSTKFLCKWLMASIISIPAAMYVPYGSWLPPNILAYLLESFVAFSKQVMFYIRLCSSFA